MLPNASRAGGLQHRSARILSRQGRWPRRGQDEALVVVGYLFGPRGRLASGTCRAKGLVRPLSHRDEGSRLCAEKVGLTLRLHVLSGTNQALLKSGWVGAGVWAWRERRPRLANECGARSGPSRAWPSAPACGGCGLDEVLTVRPAGRHAVYGRDRAGAAFACTDGPSKSVHIIVMPFVRRAAGVSNSREARGWGTPFVPTPPEQHRAQAQSPRRGEAEWSTPPRAELTDRARCYAR
jgi:hypothetical protein